MPEALSWLGWVWSAITTFQHARTSNLTRARLSPEATKPSSFQGTIYDTLPQQSEAVRLLRLLPDPDPEGEIQCELFTYILHDLGDRSHLYEALSYVWGDRIADAHISVSGRPVKITSNLHAALRRLRDHQFERVLWIDALCIDQDNKEEVAHQILFMARIYSRASRVLVWLGESADNSDDVLNSICIAASDLRVMQKGSDGPLDCLLERPWFQRVWVS